MSCSPRAPSYPYYSYVLSDSLNMISANVAVSPRRSHLVLSFPAPLFYIIMPTANRNQDENYFIAWRIGGVSVLCCFATDVQVDGKLFSEQISQVEHRNLLRRCFFTNSDKLFFSGKFHPSAFPFGIVQKYQGKIKNIRGAAALSKLGVLSPLPLLHIHLLLGYRTTGSFTHPLPSTLNRDRLKFFPRLREFAPPPSCGNRSRNLGKVI